MKIYTKTGDLGTSSLFTGQRRGKNDPIFQALGNTDQLNAHLGHTYQTLSSNQYKQIISKIQCTLLDIGSSIATPLSQNLTKHHERAQFQAQKVQQLQKLIDYYDGTLPPLTNFILPGGGQTSSRLHIARAVCRRAERSLQPLLQSTQLQPSVYRYMNRLSDFLFVLARVVSEYENPYKKPKNQLTFSITF